MTVGGQTLNRFSFLALPLITEQSRMVGHVLVMMGQSGPSQCKKVRPPATCIRCMVSQIEDSAKIINSIQKTTTTSEWIIRHSLLQMMQSTNQAPQQYKQSRGGRQGVAPVRLQEYIPPISDPTILFVVGASTPTTISGTEGFEWLFVWIWRLIRDSNLDMQGANYSSPSSAFWKMKSEFDSSSQYMTNN